MIDVYEHCEHLKEHEKSLIQIPHTLECIEKNENFKNIFTFETPFKGVKSFLNIFKIKGVENEIKMNLKINSQDILFVCTEYEVLNQYIMSLFKKVDASVYILTEGLATYLTYSVSHQSNLPIKEKIKLYYTKYILGYKYVEYLYYNKIVFPQINAKYIDGVMLYLDVQITRDITKYVISRDVKKLILDVNKAIFLNEDVYHFYCTKNEFCTILKDILENMSKKFGVVYFKFHPRETEENKLWQAEIIKKYKNIEVINDNTPFENLIETYQTKYVFSFLSAALLNVNAMGAIPVYVYHLYNAISKNSVFKQIDFILQNANYKFIDKNYNVEKIGFEQKVHCTENATLKDFIRRDSNIG
jgi:hypothetical protein